MEESKQNSTCTAVPVRKGSGTITNLSYTIPYQLLGDNTRNKAVVHAYTRKIGLEMAVIQRTAKKGKRGQKRKKEKKGKERKTNQKTSCMRAGRRPSPEGTGLLFAGTISPMICLGDRPTEGLHDKTRRKARKKQRQKKRKEKTRAATLSSENQTSISMSSWWGKDDTRDPREGRDRAAKIIATIIKRKTNITKNKTNSNIG